MSFEEKKNSVSEKIMCVIYESHLPENQGFGGKVNIFNKILHLF
jgi:hypothetical protein